MADDMPPATPEQDVGQGEPSKEDIAQELLALLDEQPRLAAAVADLIEQWTRKGGEPMSTEGTGAPETAGTTGGAPQPQGGPAAALNAGMTASPAQAGEQIDLARLRERVGSMEGWRAQSELDNEMRTAQQSYEQYKQDFPMLPEFNVREVLEIVRDNRGISVDKALGLWVMDKVRQGEGSLADRLIAAKMQNRGGSPPRVMGPGAGGVPPGSEVPKAPANRKELFRDLYEGARARFGLPG